MDAKTLEIAAVIRTLVAADCRRWEAYQEALAGLSFAQLQALVDGINGRTGRTRVPLARTGTKARLTRDIIGYRRFV